MKSKVAIFASGQGSNAQRLIEYFKDHEDITIELIVCNREEAGVYEVAHSNDVEIACLPKASFENGTSVIELLTERGVNWIILAGFLLKIPLILINAFPSKIINIHPSLLPKFGGKGMYGDKVHQAVIENKEVKSGISVHFVDEQYDTGSLIAQFEIGLDKNESIESLKKKIRALEHKHFPLVVEELLLK